MEDAKKKPIMIGIIVVCLAVAGYITFSGGGSRKPVEVPEDATIWMKCANIKCKGGTTVFEMNLREFREFQKETVFEESTPGAICQVCGKPSAFEAIECSSCQNVFILGEAGKKEISDRCPKCGYSAREEGQK